MCSKKTTVTIGESCEEVLVWQSGMIDIHVGIYPLQNSERAGYFLGYDDKSKLYVRMSSPPSCLFANLLLWYQIQETLHERGVRLVTEPPANCVGPPRGAL